jgi:hypothetical protein
MAIEIRPARISSEAAMQLPDVKARKLREHGRASAFIACTAIPPYKGGMTVILVSFQGRVTTSTQFAPASTG